MDVYKDIYSRFILEPRACYCYNYTRPGTTRWLIVRDLTTGKILKDPINKKRHLWFYNSSDAFDYLKKYKEI